MDMSFKHTHVHLRKDAFQSGAEGAEPCCPHCQGIASPATHLEWTHAATLLLVSFEEQHTHTEHNADRVHNTQTQHTHTQHTHAQTRTNVTSALNHTNTLTQARSHTHTRPQATQGLHCNPASIAIHRVFYTAPTLHIA